MATLLVLAGLSALVHQPNTTLLIVGQQQHFKNIEYKQLEPTIGKIIGKPDWLNAVDQLPETGALPIYLNTIQFLSISNKVNRHNSPSNSYALFKEVKSLKLPKNTKLLNIVLLADYAHVVSSVAAIARVYPLFNMKTKKDNNIEDINIAVVIMDKKKLAKSDVQFLNTLASSVRDSARLVDTPASQLTTDAFVEEAKAVAKMTKSKITVIKGEELLHKGFGGIYHVGKAGPTEPAFVVLSHAPKNANESYALVGKGVVFDTGGLQIKTKEGMPSMKKDMGGAGALLEAYRVLALSGFKQNLHVCLCIVENSISSNAIKPDDVITMLSNKTVEVSNTDAEGRLILADGVFYAKHVLKANTIIDMATLTGSQKIATGLTHSAVVTNKEEWENKVIDAGKRSGDLVAPLLFAPELHFADFKSPVADMKNAKFGILQGPSTSMAGLFISSHIDFGEGLNWIHIDMSGPTLHEERATGHGAALVVALLGNETNVPILQ